MSETYRMPTRQVRIGDVPVGGGAPIAVQSMVNIPLQRTEEVIGQILALEQAGCQIVRFAVSDLDQAPYIRQVKERTHIPLVADIHFDYRIALGCAAAGIDKIRINPGNIGSEARVREVVAACKLRQIPIRIGVNGGSLDREILEKYGRPTPEALVESAMKHVHILEENHFDQIVVSIKSSDVPTMVRAYELMRERRDYPLHLGVTEAGTAAMGVVKNAVGIGALLLRGIGDTIRVSLTADPLEEISAAYRILRAVGLYHEGVEVISCPTCGRTSVDLIGLAAQVENALAAVKKPLKVAVMGCVVNGPGEAREADIGIAAADGMGILFKKGEYVKKVPEERIVAALLAEIESM